MRFANNYYAELEEADGTLATEVLVDPGTGAVQLEFGPAMMWNTRYGMMASPRARQTRSAPSRPGRLPRSGLTTGAELEVEEPEAFPGYYTLHTLEGGDIDGMLSVNAATGAVWYHSWHGDFEEMSEGG